MKKIQEMNDVASEVLMILNYFNNDMLERIPTEFLEELEEQASTSTYNVEIDSTKKLTEQNISEKSKDLISLIYYSYIADETERIQIMKLWNENEKIYQEELRERYNPNIWKQNNKKIKNEEVSLIKVKKEKWYKKLFLYLRNKFKK